jgi:hypothetical protein
MKKYIWFTSLAIVILFTKGFCQKPSRHIGEPIWIDSLSTIFFPTTYNDEFISTNKIAFWGDYYSNIIVYDFKKDEHRKLFQSDTYVHPFHYNNGYRTGNNNPQNITSKWVFILAKDKDYNTNGRIDERDPSVLFVTNKKGEGLKSLTAEGENILSIKIYEDKGFGLISFQRDSDKDKSFKNLDSKIIYRKIDLNDLSLGKEIAVE